MNFNLPLCLKDNRYAYVLNNAKDSTEPLQKDF